jgi:hypothetical protein
MMSRIINLIVVHCSATSPDLDIGVNEIDEWHKARGWSGIGYNNIIRRNGILEHGRDLADIPAHAYGYNRNSIGICLIGGVDNDGNAEDNFTPQQKDALRAYLNTMLDIFPEAKLLGHRDLSPDINGDGIIEKWEWKKECPCFDVREWYYGERD